MQPTFAPSPQSARQRLTRAAVLFASVAALAACGGGGTESPTPAPTPTPATTPTPTPTPTPAPPPASGNVTISGKATFESVPAASNGGLNYVGRTYRPVRGATVSLLDASGNTVASTTSNASGDYSFTNVAQATYRVRVRAELLASNHNFAVRDNTSGGALYVMDSAAVAVTNNTTVDVAAPSGWGGSSYTGTRVAGPFAILDVAYLAKEKILAASPSAVMQPLTLNWSVNNRPVDGSLSSGAIGTSFFTTDSGGNALLYLLGAENTDTDEYDQPVVAHEIGHYMQHALFEDDSIGGPHSGNDKLDMRVAFSEGWGNAWAGMVLNNPTYHDSRATAQASGFTVSLTATPSSAVTGWFNEHTVEYLLWQSHQDANVGFNGIYAAMAALRNAPVFTSIHAFTQRLKEAVPGQSSTIASRGAAVGVNGTDLYGVGETNNGGLAAALPVYSTVSVGVTQQVCATSNFGAGNKLGTHAYVRFTTSGARTINVTRSAGTATGTDPDLRIITATGSRLVAESSAVDVETTTATLPSGTHVMAINDYNQTTTSATSCFDVRID